MRLPPSVRYLPSRLQALSNPWLWLGLMVTGIIGVYAFEYRRNPGQLWQSGTSTPGPTAEATPTDVLLESLTPEERAVASELDNIELLLAQLDANVSVLTTGGESSAAAALNAAPSGLGNAGSIDEFVGESSVDRLNRYIDEYRFLGTRANGANVQTADMDEATRSAQASQPRSETTEPAQIVNALADALARQQAEQAPEAVPESDAESGRFSTENGEPDPAGTVETPAFSFGQTGVVPGSLDGLNQSFIRTTPDMSPPPGTTGYVPPASLSDFNQLNQPADTNPFVTQPSGSLGIPSPAGIPTPDRTQVLPPAQDSIVTPLADPRFDGSQQSTPNQPRNAWESFFD